MNHKWDKRMLDLATVVSTWSKDPSTQVGAVITDARHRVVSLGFNGFPHGVEDDEDALNNREEKLRRTIHAEENALLFARSPVDGCIAYVTYPPCGRCAAKLIQAGIARVHVLHPAMGSRWEADVVSARKMYLQAGIELTFAQVTHGLDCTKAMHCAATAYLHTEADDTPYDVDGVLYCGRCHEVLP